MDLACVSHSYEIMHSCWSPVPKCRPSFQHLIDQLEGLWTSLSPEPHKEPLLYVNLEGEERVEQGAGALGPEEPPWEVPWQCGGLEDDEKDWLMVSSGAALAIGGDYRYIIGPCSNMEEEMGEDGRRAGESMDRLQREIRDEEDDVVINV